MLSNRRELSCKPFGEASFVFSNFLFNKKCFQLRSLVDSTKLISITSLNFHFNYFAHCWRWFCNDGNAFAVFLTFTLLWFSSRFLREWTTIFLRFSFLFSWRCIICIVNQWAGKSCSLVNRKWKLKLLEGAKTKREVGKTYNSSWNRYVRTSLIRNLTLIGHVKTYFQLLQTIIVVCFNRSLIIHIFRTV